MSTLSGYGRELFATFVPSSARARVEARGGRRYLLSGALIARNASALAGPVIEVTWTGKPSLVGVLRAARHHDAVVAVGVPAVVRTASPQAPRMVVDEILAAADAALFDRPIIVVARAQPLPPGASIDRLSEAIHRDLEAGFTSMAFLPAALSGDVDALARVTAPLVEQDIGIEVELDGSASSGGGDAALVLARIDDAGLSLAAVRGAEPHDELAGAMLVVDDGAAAPTLEPAPVSILGGGAGAAATGRRVVVDGRLQRAILRNTGDDEKVEAACYLEIDERVAALGASGTASRLLDALAQSMHK